jgi:hypothetical protein
MTRSAGMSNRGSSEICYFSFSPVPVLLGIAFVASFIRLAPLLRHGVATNPDSRRYIELAQGLNHGCGFARWLNNSCGTVETFRTPGYPLFLAVMPSLRTAVAIQVFMGAAVCLLIGLFVLDCWGPTAAVAAELIVAFDIPSILFGAMILSDLLFQFLVTAGVVLGLWASARGSNDPRATTAIIVGAILFGVAILVRPIGIVLIVFAGLPVFLLPRISWRRTMTTALLACAIPSIFTLCWMVRNDHRTGVSTLSTVGSLNLYFYRAAGVVWSHGDKSFPAVQEEFGRALGWPMRDFNDAPPSLEPAMKQRALRIIKNDPIAFILMTVRCFLWLMVVPERADLNGFLGTNAGATSYLAASGDISARIREIRRSPLLTALVALQFMVTILIWIGVGRVLTGLCHKSAVEISMILFMLMLTMGFLVLASGAESVARFRLPVIPLLAVLAAIGWCGRFTIVRGSSASGGAQTEHGPTTVTAN